MVAYKFGLGTVLVCVLAYLIAAGSVVQGAETRQQMAQRINATTVSIVAGGIHSTSARLVEDIGIALNDRTARRVLPVLGFGSAQNISDVLYLKGVDAGIVQADVLEAVREDDVIPGITSKLEYIAELCTENVFIVAGKGINSVNDLAGKVVNFGPYAVDSYSTPALLFKALGINVKRVSLPHSEALGKMAESEIAATVVLGHDLRMILANTDTQASLTLLPVPQSELPDYYIRTTLTAQDLPGVLKEDSQLDTVSVPLVLVVNRWPTRHNRHRKMTDFVQALFSKLPEMQKPPYDPEWKKVKLTTTRSNWSRFKASEDWLVEHEDDRTVAELREDFAEFLKKSGSTKLEALTDEQQTDMFNKFLAWEKNTSEAEVSVRLTSADGVGKKLGTLTIMNSEIVVGNRKEKALVLRPNLKGMRSGAYAFHVHEFPDCGPAEKDGKLVPGLAAGGHLWVSGTGAFEGQVFGSHLGDLPDLIVDEDGTATKPVVAARLTLADIVNRAITVHASSNDASARYACAVIK